MMHRTVLAVAAIAIGVTAVAAQSDPIATRKATMKNVGAVTKTGGQMVKGEVPYDQAKAQEIFATYVDASTKMPTLFPESSKTGGDTAALPAIWTGMDDFKAKFAKFGSDAKAARASVKDLDSFKASFGTVTKNCGGCHETYRAKKS
ncbi:MAG TPA: cytochrome c [Xanthobacteraceae bacterium]|nr:cytochrome c [Xanthobacteraceae bacterium]